MNPQFDTCREKQQRILDLFAHCPTEQDKYAKIIELGKQQHPLDLRHKTAANIVKGCQSTVYLHTYADAGKVLFEAESEALISAGLAAILIAVYNGEPAEVILTCPPDYLDQLGIGASLTPSRANGLYSIHLRMKQEALKLLMEQKTA